MKFYIKKVVIWLVNGQRRDFDFLPNKVNVITGDSSTGKSTVLKIIDYCFCKNSRPSKIPEEVINENATWYGVSFSINGKDFVIARGKVVDGALSSDYYFSSTGEVPAQPTAIIAEAEVKKILEGEFSIDSNLVVPYGGRMIKAGSKLSFRYFLLFNTQSDTVINNEEQFFDKVNTPRYKEALDRIFNLAIESASPEGVLVAEQLAKLAKDETALERKAELFAKQRAVFQGNILELISKAQTAGLIDGGLPTIAEGVAVLNGIVQNYMSSYRRETLLEAEGLQRQKRDVVRRLRNIELFEKSYAEYLDTVRTNADSLQPVSFLKQHFADLVLAPSVATIFDALETRLAKLKQELVHKKPIAANLSDEKDLLDQQLEKLDGEIRLYPTKSPDFVAEAQRLMLVGEIKAKLELYTQVADDIDFSGQLAAIRQEIEELQAKARALGDNKGLVIDLLQEHIQKYISASTALGVYQTYKAFFNEKDKILQLRKPGSLATSDVGSSSTHLFLHLCLFLGLHDFFLQRKSKYVPQFLILDQLSRPYYEEARKKEPTLAAAGAELDDSMLESDDRKKLREAFKLLDSFVDSAQQGDSAPGFQIIVLEHVSKAFFEEIEMKHYHLVATFRDGNALIPMENKDAEAATGIE